MIIKSGFRSRSISVITLTLLILYFSPTRAYAAPLAHATDNQAFINWPAHHQSARALHNRSKSIVHFRDVSVMFEVASSNDGTLIVLDSEVQFPKGLVNNGALLFDPSTITVSTLQVNPNGYLAETGGPGDRFIITEDFINQSTRNTDWYTPNTIFQFNGGVRTIANPQTIEVAAVDIGAQGTGWNNNFAFGPLQVGTSDTYVRLIDSYNNSASCLSIYCELGSNEALYVNNVIIEAGATLDLNGFRLYSRNPVTNNGGTIVNGSISIGATTGDGDINGNGVVDTGDLQLGQKHVLGTALLNATQVARGDLYPQTGGDNLFTVSDLVLLTRIVVQQ